MVKPCAVVGTLHARQQLLQHIAQVTHQPHIHAHIFVQLRGVNVNMDLARIDGVCFQVAGDAVIKAHAKSKQQICLLDGAVDVSLAVHAHHAKVEAMAGRNAAKAQQRHGNRHLRALCKLQHLRPGAGRDDAMARKDQRPLGIVDQMQRALQLARQCAQVRPVAGQAQGTDLPNKFGAALLCILGNVHQHRPLASAARNEESLFDGARNVFRACDKIVVLGNGQCHAGHIRFLKRIRADGLAAHLASDANNRHRVHHGRGNARNHVCGARPGGGNRHAHFAGSARVAVSHVRSTLFMAHQHMVDLVAQHGIVCGQDGAAGIPEYNFDAL